MKTKEKLQKKLAQWEFANDQLISELTYIDDLMRLVGFSSGIAGLKETAQEYCEQSEINPQEDVI